MLILNLNNVKYKVSKKKTFIKKLLKKDLDKVCKNPKKTIWLQTNLTKTIWQYINKKN